MERSRIGRKLSRLAAGIAPAIVCFSLLASVASSEDRNPPWKALEDEAVSLLSRYIQIDTTNPPGNEIRAARFFKEILQQEGIDSRIIESAPGRGNIYARLPGDGSKKGVVLLHHMDVVPADGKLWQEPPFSGVVKNGDIWGRGSLDMKGPGIVELMAVLILKRQGVPLKGDLVFLGTADEEAGGAMGAGFLLAQHPELFKNVGLVLNEGGGIRLGTDARVRYYSVSVAEKTPLWLRLSASGRAGHGSTPGNNLAVNKLLAALHRVMLFQSPIKVVPEVQRFYAQTAHLEPASRREQYTDLGTALRDPAFVADFTKDPRANASVRNTISITRLHGSAKVNVIPGLASAELDVRLLPGEDANAFIETLRQVIADDAIKVDVLLSFPPSISPPHPGAMNVIAAFAQAHDEGAPVVAPLLRGFTDCHFFRERAIPCLGFMPIRSPAAGDSLVHGVNERISVQQLKFAVRAMYDIVRKLVAE